MEALGDQLTLNVCCRVRNVLTKSQTGGGGISESALELPKLSIQVKTQTLPGVLAAVQYNYRTMTIRGIYKQHLSECLISERRGRHIRAFVYDARNPKFEVSVSLERRGNIGRAFEIVLTPDWIIRRCRRLRGFPYGECCSRLRNPRQRHAGPQIVPAGNG